MRSGTGGRRVSAFVALVCLLLATGGAGCAMVIPRNTPANAIAADKAVIPGIPKARVWGDVDPIKHAERVAEHMPVFERLAKSARVVKGRPQVYFLALSGGGPGGAFGAGLLKGWTESGKRPTFDVVTGVSAGAIIAPFAYLGPDYDKQLESIWTQYETDQLVVAQLLPAIFGGSALADTAPLKKLVDRYVDRAFLRKIAGEYGRGRLLLIGTTNLDAQRPVYWNMGEIAASRHPRKLELFRKIIMASAAIPGAFPPVSIEAMTEGRLIEEMHVDGGTTRDVFIAPFQMRLRDLDRLYSKPPQRHIYIIMNGKMAPEFKPVNPTAVAIGARAVTTLIRAHDSGDLFRISLQAAEAGAAFNFVSIPASFTAEPKQTFDPVYQRALFETGEALGRSGGGWESDLRARAAAR